MSKAVAARLLGDDYQAMVFWSKACRLLIGEDDIETVEIESDSVKSLDDVVVHHKKGWCDEMGDPVRIEFFQVKFHVSYNGAISSDALIDPVFINASKVSFLQRAKAAWDANGQSGVRIVLYNSWGFDPADGLGDLISCDNGRVKTEKWSGLTDKSKLGRIRAKWRAHLSCSETELEHFLMSLRLVPGANLSDARRDLNHSLCLAGLKTFETRNPLNHYAALARSFIESGSTVFTRDRLIEKCKAADLWAGGPIKCEHELSLGIRSYERGTGNFLTWGNERLDLLSSFHGRDLKDGLDWDDDIASPVIEFLDKHLSPGSCVRLWLPAHYTIAAVAGFCLDARSGVHVVIRQAGIYGMSDWGVPRPGEKCSETPCFQQCDEDIVKDGPDLAVAISAANDIAEDVRVYIENSGVSIQALRSISLTSCGSEAISGPESAVCTVEGIIQSIRNFKKKRRCSGKIHMFYSVPAFMVFMLGQKLRTLGMVQLYEHDLESGVASAYKPSLIFPLKKGN